MKRTILALILLICFIATMTACSRANPMTFTSPTVYTDPTDPTVTPDPPEPEHSELYIPDLPVEDVITYFNEVALDAEYSDGDGNPSLIQKWEEPLVYRVLGWPTEKDLQVLTDFCAYLNTIEGFPGIREANATEAGNLQITFCSRAGIIAAMGSEHADADGLVTYWYNNDRNDIYKSDIYISTEVLQEVRNSVIQEELYNGLGLTQDTSLREDSIIFSGYSTPQELTEIDDLLLKLICHPDIKPGMNAAQCEAVIRSLYY